MGIKLCKNSPHRDCFASDTAPRLLTLREPSTRDSLNTRHGASEQVYKFLRSSWGSRDLEIHGRGGREQLSPERTTLGQQGREALRQTSLPGPKPTDLLLLPRARS